MITSCATVMLSPTQAQWIAENCLFPRQRPISESNVRRLLGEMRAGRFVRGTPITFGLYPDEHTEALNGNHTVRAIARHDQAIELTTIYHPVKSIDEAGEIYARLDRQKVRSKRDQLRAFGEHEMLGGSSRWTEALAASVGEILTSFKRASSLDLDTKRPVMRAALDAASIYVDCLTGLSKSDEKIYRRSCVMSVAIEIIRAHPSTGAEFFSGMAADDGLVSGDPRRTLLRFLRDNGARDPDTHFGMSKRVAVAWNAFFEGRELTKLVPSKSGDVILRGTPWDGSFDPVAKYLPQRAQAPGLVKKPRESSARWYIGPAWAKS